LTPLSLFIVFPVVSSAVFLSVSPTLIAVEFGSSSQLLSRGFSFRHDGEGGRWKREKEGEEAVKARVADHTAGMMERISTPLSIYRSDRQGRDEAVAQEGAQNSVKKESPFWDPSIEGERKGDLGADFTSFVLPRVRLGIRLGGQ
jgi:hypothetical protein